MKWITNLLWLGVVCSGVSAIGFMNWSSIMFFIIAIIFFLLIWEEKKQDDDYVNVKVGKK